MTTSKLQRQVIEFHQTFDIPILPGPGVPGEERVRLRARLVVEECLEMIEAMFAVGKLDAHGAEMSVMKRICSRIITDAPIRVNLPELADAFADIDYIVEGSRLEFGIEGGAVADEVHRSNMAKAPVCAACDGNGFRQKNDHDSEDCPRCGGKGRIILKRADSKVQKPEGWTPPDIEAQITYQHEAPLTRGLAGVLEKIAKGVP